MNLSLFIICVLLGLGVLLGCSPERLPGDYGPLVKFKDQVESNSNQDASQLAALVLTKVDGTQVPLRDVGGDQHILLVISRGLVGSTSAVTLPDGTEATGHSFCIFCSTQTSRLVANYQKFKQRNTEVVLVFPVARASDVPQVQEFAAKVKGPGNSTEDFPFPVVLDVELLTVDALGIRDDLSKPATYIIDSQGQLQFGYVGQAISDRPSIQSLLDQLDRIEN